MKFRMRQTVFKIVVLVLMIVSIISCANRGTPSGGEMDILPPKIIKSTPENFSTNFNGKEIRIYFDEYIKIKDVQKQLIISPPMDPEPDITPLGSASKYIKIIIKDTLEANTTYAFNFGQSIVDNNEENPYPYYRYVFSTGDYIDSLSVKGTIMDAEKRVADKFVSVMLYGVDSTFTDSIIYNKKPKYITNTLDSLTSFSIDNIKAGKYLLVALKDENRNFTFQQKTDKIGFYDTFITVPSDSSYNIKLFKEVVDFRAERPKQIAGQKIAFGYEGDAKDMTIEMLDSIPDDFEVRLTKDPKADTLYYWYKPKLELDSTRFVVRNKTYIDTLKHRFRDLEKDSLTIRAFPTGNINFDENFTLEGTIPFTKIDENRIKIIDKDSINVPFKTQYDSLKNTYSFQFEKKESNAYSIKMLPEAFTDFFGNVNDTLNYTTRTKAFDQYGNMRVSLVNAKYPVIVQLTDDKGAVKYEKFATEPRLFDFRYINPANYYLRVIFDGNGNQQWDSGSYLKKRQPERVSYYPDLLDVRAGWDLVIEFILEKTDPDPPKN
ncbi:MAG: Ig-like domain-containing protein [Gelidibacter sp.]